MSINPKILKLTDHFFRYEHAKMVAVIGRYFHTSEINLAEDIVQDTLLEAIKNWEFKGIPPDPKAWLYTVAKNKTLNILKRDQTARKANEQLFEFSENFDNLSINEIFSTERIADDQLRMMFVCCHPALTEESQIAFLLKTLCGLSISEIGRAFLTSTETINKKLIRARKSLRENNVSFDIPNNLNLGDRLSVVLKSIYLLFNEGYNATRGEKIIRNELCIEAIRLAEIIHRHDDFSDNHHVSSLLSLMYLNVARFESRVDSTGNIVEMKHQDRAKWNQKLMDRGLFLLGKFSEDVRPSTYHIMATISANHCTAKSYESTDWMAITSLYEQLLQLDNSPIVKLNHAIATSKVAGNTVGIEELLKLEATEELIGYVPLYSVLANLYMEEEQFEKASGYFQKAIGLTKSTAELSILTSKLDKCKITS